MSDKGEEKKGRSSNQSTVTILRTRHLAVDLLSFSREDVEKRGKGSQHRREFRLSISLEGEGALGQPTLFSIPIFPQKKEGKKRTDKLDAALRFIPSLISFEKEGEGGKVSDEEWTSLRALLLFLLPPLLLDSSRKKGEKKKKFEKSSRCVL